jgi:hypothetical protein
MSDSTPQGGPAPDARFDHEPSTINVRTIVLFAVGLAGIVGVVQVAIAIAMNWISHDERRIDQRYPDGHAIEVDQFPSPRLQANPEQELEQIKQHELDQLQSYGWVDGTAGIAHIPIDRALDIVASKGLPKIPAPELKPGEAAPIGVSPLPVSGDELNPGHVAKPSVEPGKSGQETRKDLP